MGDERCTDGVREKANASVVAEDANTKKTTGGEQRMVEELRKRARLLLGEGGSVVVCCVREVSKCQRVDPNLRLVVVRSEKKGFSEEAHATTFLPSPY